MRRILILASNAIILGALSACSLAPVPALTPTPFPTSTFTPAATPTFTPYPTPTFTPTLKLKPSPSPTLTPSPTPPVPQTAVVSAAKVNVRQGPGTIYPSIAQVSGGTQFEIRARNERGDWIKVCCVNGREGWVSASLLSIPGEIALIKVTTDIPPTPTPAPTPTPTPTPAPVVSCPAGMECGERFYEPLGKMVRYYRGWKYEFVDASDRFDIVFVRDVYGYFMSQYWGDKFSFIRWTIMDRYVPDECPPSGTLANLISYAPIPLTDIYPPPCRNRSLSVYGGDGAGAMVGVGCDMFKRSEKECFIAIISDGPYLTDCIIGYLIVAPEGRYIWKHPVFDVDDRFRILGQPRREGDQWRWDDPFLEIVPAR